MVGGQVEFVLRGGGGLLIESMVEDGGDTFVVIGTKQKSAGAGGLEAVIAVGLGQAQDTQARPIGLLGVTSLAKAVRDELRGGGPALEALVLLWSTGS